MIVEPSKVLHIVGLLLQSTAIRTYDIPGTAYS